MKPKHRRLLLVLLAVSAIALGVGAILTAFSDSLIFFFTPSQLAERKQDRAFDASRVMRVGGLVKNHSVKHGKDGELTFVVTDLTSDLAVTYRGFVPSLFREGQGVVAQGKLDEKGVLHATQILAKHDENYMPREVMDALKASGRWQEGQGAVSPNGGTK